MGVCLSICLSSVCLDGTCESSLSFELHLAGPHVRRASICLSVYLYFCLSVCLPACLPACVPACLSVEEYLSVYLFVFLPACLSVCLPACHVLPVWLSTRAHTLGWHARVEFEARPLNSCLHVSLSFACLSV